MQDALTHLQDVISVEVSLPDKAVIKVRKNAVTVDALAKVIKEAGFSAKAK